jgi:hypothetical protein
MIIKNEYELGIVKAALHSLRHDLIEQIDTGRGRDGRNVNVERAEAQLQLLDHVIMNNR